jgi:hypothetical protein
MSRISLGFAAALLVGGGLGAQKPPLLPEKDVAALANELSGETAKRNLEAITLNHRQRGSKGFHAAAEIVAQRLREYGLNDVAILQFPADGKIFYGTQRSRPAWEAELGELTELNPVGPPLCDKERVENGKIVFNTECGPEYARKIASYEAMPIVLAEDSESADVRAELVDVGEGRNNWKDCLGECAARRGAGASHREVWSGRDCELCAKPENRLVGRRRELDPLGTLGSVFG